MLEAIGRLEEPSVFGMMATRVIIGRYLLREGPSFRLRFLILGTDEPLSTLFRAMRKHLSSRARRGAGSQKQGCHADLDSGTGDVDGADKQADATLLSCEHVLNRGAHGPALVIGIGDLFRHSAAVPLAVMGVASNMPRSKNASFLIERLAVSAPTPDPVFFLVIRSRSRAPSGALAALHPQLRISS